jgi:Copper transport outer membrane protein, MctB
MIGRLLLSFVAIVAAMAGGVALGGGPLSDIGRTPSQAAAAPAGPRSDPQAQARAAYGEAFAGSIAQSLYAGRLHGHPVAVLTLPGTDPDVVDSLALQVRAAGTQVVATYALKRALLDPGEKTLVDTLGLQLVEQLGTEVVTAGATTYDRMGQLIGHAVAARSPKTAMAAAKVSSLRASLDGAGLMTVPEGEPNVAPMVLVLGAAEVEQPVLSGLLAGLAAVARGVVVAGPTGDPGITGLRAEAPLPTVATVDGVDTAAGRVATVLTLVHAVDSPGGSYGAAGADGPAPLG